MNAETQDQIRHDELKEIREQLSAGASRMEKIEGRMTKFEDALKVNTDLTQHIFENTKGLVELIESVGKGVFFLCRAAKAITWAGDLIHKLWKPTAGFLSIYVIYIVISAKQEPTWLTKLFKIVLGI